METAVFQQDLNGCLIRPTRLCLRKTELKATLLGLCTRFRSVLRQGGRRFDWGHWFKFWHKILQAAQNSLPVIPRR